MNKNSVKYWQGNHSGQLTIAQNTEIKNLGRATPDLYISSLHKAEYKYLRKFNPDIYTKQK
jgi:hypothetical protein